MTKVLGISRFPTLATDQRPLTELPGGLATILHCQPLVISSSDPVFNDLSTLNMTNTTKSSHFQPDAESMMRLCHDLYPISRSLTGEGVRQTLALLKSTILGANNPVNNQARAVFDIGSVRSHTPVFDWTVPREWKVKHARLFGPDGQCVIDYAKHNLHLLGYSSPFKGTVSLSELKAHLHSLPDRPDWIPYRTSYYAENWGFCLSHRQLEKLPDGQYQVDIKTELFDGEMNWGEVFLPGETDDEILISTHICHPSLANDNLSGLVVATALIHWLSEQKLRLGVRVIFVPATIGAITWLALSPGKLERIRHTLVLSNLGDTGSFHYKLSPDGKAVIDSVFTHLRDLDPRFKTLELMPFSPYGYDERQYNSPGIALDAGSLMRTPFGQYPQYHTSADNLDFINPQSLKASLDLCITTITALQSNLIYESLNPMGEPQLGKRGLYEAIGGDNQKAQRQLAMLWILNQANGRRSLIEIAQKAGIHIETLAQVAAMLEENQLLQRITPTNDASPPCVKHCQ